MKLMLREIFANKKETSAKIKKRNLEMVAFKSYNPTQVYSVKNIPKTWRPDRSEACKLIAMLLFPCMKLCCRAVIFNKKRVLFHF